MSNRDDYEYGVGSPQRWDRDRFERTRARRDYDDDRYYDDRRDVRVDINERGPRGGRVEESINIREDDRYGPRRDRRPGYLDEERTRITERQIAPYRPREEERYREYDRYYEQDRYRDPYERPLPPRARSPPREPARDDERNVTLNVNVTGPDPGYYPPRPYEREWEYEGARFTREDISIHEDDYSVRSPPKKIRSTTRCPKRVFHKRALIEFNLTFTEDVCDCCPVMSGN